MDLSSMFTNPPREQGQTGWRGVVHRAIEAWLAHYQRVVDAQPRHPHGF